MLEQGLSFTVIEAPHPLEGDSESFDARQQMYAAHRVWLGWSKGADWLHDAVEQELGEDSIPYSVTTKRDAIHIGAAGEIAAVVLILLGRLGWAYAKAFGEELGRGHAEALLDWARACAAERRKEQGLEHSDPPPNFHREDPKHLAQGLLGELAEIAGLAEEDLEITLWERRADMSMRAIYEVRGTEISYEVVAYRDSATFKRIGAPSPPPVQ